MNGAQKESATSAPGRLRGRRSRVRVLLAFLVVGTILFVAAAVLDFFNVWQALGFGRFAAMTRAGEQIRQGDYEGAIATCNRAIRWYPRFGGLYWTRGKAYAKLGELDKAIADYSEFLKTPSGWAYRDRGLLYERKGDLDNALADYITFVLTYAKHTDEYRRYQKARAEGRVGDSLDEVLALYDERIRESRPKDETLEQARACVSRAREALRSE